jgi:hypothetical protein
VTRRDHPVLAAVDEPHRRPDGREVDAPRRDQGEIVVDEALGRGGAGSLGVGPQGAPRSPERRPVGGREAGRVELVGLREALACLASALGRDEASGGDHPRVPVRTRRERRGAAQRHGGYDAVRQDRGAGQRVRPAARCTHHGEPVHARGVHQLRHVRRRRPHRPSTVRAGSAVARPAVRHEPDASSRRRLHDRIEQGSRLGRPVVPHQREGARRSTRVMEAQLPAVLESNVHRLRVAPDVPPSSNAARPGDRLRPPGCS